MGSRRALGVLVALALTTGTMPAGPEASAGTGGPARNYVAWATEGLPGRTARELKRVRGIRAVGAVRLGIAFLTRSTIDSRTVDDPPDGHGYPLEVAVVPPGPFARFAAGEDRAAIRALEPGEVLLSRSAARQRGAGAGLRLVLEGHRVRVVSVIGDRSAHGAELIVAKPVPKWLGSTIRYFMVRADPDTPRSDLRAAVRRAAPSAALQIRSDSQARFLRHAPNVRPLSAFKRAFGEFPARPAGSGPLSLWGRWVERHISTRQVPLLGRVRCHRKLFPMLRGALGELRDKELGHLIRPSEYAGCYYPRYVASPPGVRLSRHSWGIAVDINTSGNGFGQEPQQDRRVVRIFEKWGFMWGGTWPTPDGMHFEWSRFP